MKKLHTTLLVVIFCTISISEAKAQYGVQAGVMLPTGDWSSFWGAGFGGQVFYKIDQGDDISYGGSIGYFSLPGEEVNLLFVTLEYPDASVIPILGTFDYKINDKFYAGGDVGYNVISIGDLEQGLTSAASSSFALIPKAGVKFGSLHAEARFNIVGDGYLSLAVGLTL